MYKVNKVNKMISLDINHVDKLSEVDNVSALINQLLHEYFLKTSEKAVENVKKTAILSDFRVKKREIDTEIKQIKALSRLNLPDSIINRLKTMPEYSEYIALNIKKEHGLLGKIPTEDLKTAWEVLHNVV